MSDWFVKNRAQMLGHAGACGSLCEHRSETGAQSVSRIPACRASSVSRRFEQRTGRFGDDHIGHAASVCPGLRECRQSLVGKICFMLPAPPCAAGIGRRVRQGSDFARSLPLPQKRVAKRARILWSKSWEYRGPSTRSKPFVAMSSHHVAGCRAQVSVQKRGKRGHKPCQPCRDHRSGSSPSANSAVANHVLSCQTGL